MLSVHENLMESIFGINYSDFDSLKMTYVFVENWGRSMVFVRSRVALRHSKDVVKLRTTVEMEVKLSRIIERGNLWTIRYLTLRGVIYTAFSKHTSFLFVLSV